MPRFGVPVGRRFTYLIQLLIRSIHWFYYIASHSLYIAQSYTYNDANRYNLPNIARIFGRINSLLFALCNLFSTSKKLRFLRSVERVPWDWSVFTLL